MPDILIVEDDEDIGKLVSLSCRNEGWHPVHVKTAEEALIRIRADRFDVCVLDLMLPGMDGLSFLKVIRSMSILSFMHIIIASAKDDDSDIVAGLEIGADDYVVKPFSPRVLVARIRAALRRNTDSVTASGQKPAVFEHRGIAINKERHSVTISGKPVDFSATEFGILELLVREPGRVFTREQIINHVKGPDYPVTDRAIDVHILSIRRKLDELADLVETIRGIGYRLKDS